MGGGRVVNSRAEEKLRLVSCAFSPRQESDIVSSSFVGFFRLLFVSDFPVRPIKRQCCRIDIHCRAPIWFSVAGKEIWVGCVVSGYDPFLLSRFPFFLFSAPHSLGSRVPY